MGKRILVVSDMDFKFSGYMNIVVNLCKGLAEKGYEIKCVGVNYKGEEHDFPFSILPANDVGDGAAILHNMIVMWHPQIVITAFDITLQQQFLLQVLAGLKSQFKFYHVGITALENGPLMDDWALVLSQINKVFFISELGKQEGIKAGLSNVDHIIIGIDSNTWSPLAADDRSVARKNLGYNEDDFIVITVADNQERKNLFASFMAISYLDNIPNVKHVLVTREHNPYGWHLRSLANSLKISDKLFIYERGMGNRDLRLLYGISDAFLLLSRAEGLGMPILEAMACGVPCVCTDTGAMHELLSGGRGFLVSSEYEIALDTWGNSKRTFADPQDAATFLELIAENDGAIKRMITLSRKYIQKRTWSVPVHQLDELFKELPDEIV